VAAAHPEFLLSSGEVRAFAAAGLGGALGAALAMVVASDAHVAAGADGACLLHVPPGGAGGPAAPRLEVLSVSRCAAELVHQLEAHPYCRFKLQCHDWQNTALRTAQTA